MSNKQLEAWVGDFGNEYTERNYPIYKDIKNRKNFWDDFNYFFNKSNSILEVGSNVGANLIAIDDIYENKELYAIEPNDVARGKLQHEKINNLHVLGGSACNIPLKDNTIDLVFTCGVLIHIHPNDIGTAITEVYRVAKKYIICAEYFSPEQREIKYQGRDNMLWTRDYGTLFLGKYLDLKCNNCTFYWKRTTGMDNLTVWVFEKNQ